jgi:hypothetical protein
MSKSIEEWNEQVLFINQALLGSVTHNFRMVTISYENAEWVLRFYLEKYDDVDIEEIIEEILIDYESYIGYTVNYRDEIIICDGDRPEVDPPSRTVFMRREVFLGDVQKYAEEGPKGCPLKIFISDTLGRSKEQA